ncbi:MAG TPA: hypothetical protein VFT86_01110, partial [Gaiellaceae bacterium]|nr:hypothetical protein [Gaiellaceae bacterium]
MLPLRITCADPAVAANPLTDFTYGVTTNVGDTSAPSTYVWAFALPFGASLQLLPNGSVAVIRPESPPSDLGEMTEAELDVAERLFAQERNRSPDPPVSPEDEQAAAALDTYAPLPEVPET